VAAAHKQRWTAAVGDLCEHGVGVALVARDVVRLVGLDVAHQVVRDTRAVGEAGRRGPDLHPPVHLARIRRDDLRAEPFRELERQRRLPHRRRPAEHHQPGRCLHPLSTPPRHAGYSRSPVPVPRRVASRQAPGEDGAGMTSASAHVIAVDLGGTQFRVALFDAAGRLLRREAFPTHGEQGPAAVLDRIAAGCRDMLTQLPAGGSLAGVGVAAPSPIDPKRGVVYQAPNLPGWVDIPLRDELARRLDLPVLAGNDANLAALGEWRFGAGRDHGDLVYLTIST